MIERGERGTYILANMMSLMGIERSPGLFIVQTVCLENWYTDMYPEASKSSADGNVCF